MTRGFIRYFLLATIATATFDAASAAEGGSGFYLLGSKGSLAGILPPEGLFFTNDNYFYSGEASGSARFPTIGGELAVGLDADVYVNISTGLYVTPYEILGGRLAFGAAIPVVRQHVNANAAFSLGGVPIVGGALSDIETAFGDPILIGALGWNIGNWHATLYNLVNVPGGPWTEDALANTGFNRWGYDITLATTYLDPTTGFEVSISPGFTFNGENLDTGYQSGTEFHVEFAAMKHFSEQFAFGINGYRYDQVTGDSGSATSDFKGSVTSVGPALNWNFQLGELPGSLKAKYLYEFGAENRLEGQSVLFQLAIPLYVPKASSTDLN